MEKCQCGGEPKRKLFTDATCRVCGKQFPEIPKIKKNEDVYCFRSECVKDVAGFLSNLWPGCMLRWTSIVSYRDKPDCLVTMKIFNTCLEEIRMAMSGVPDGHVMIESLNYRSAYTGERWFNSQSGQFGSLTCDYKGVPPFADAEWANDEDAMCLWCAGTGHPYGDERYGICKCPKN